MKIAFAALAVLFLAAAARADSLTNASGTIIYPDGSTITSESGVVPTASNGYLGYTNITFQFLGGSGFATTAITEGAGDLGGLAFTVPVSNLTVFWEDPAGAGIYMNFSNVSTQEEIETIMASGFSGSVTLAGPGIFSMSYAELDGGNAAVGIDALTYTIAGPPSGVPEPSSLLLAGMGLIALVGLRRRR